ncbi:ABC transporter ATP-binding protein (plasmid) [Salimicrobium jeotgali]|uniref:ABC transporter ATP-binding protein n=1 Tax=Salimicrobium jeotgali TaxID=1230341 RepID=K2H4H8_9BACI|nr:ABC transporter ATP-binding protein [Salimicrobium jeotgali]AKG05853.1 ABC transporter ATP-binding protein [Salimicrobium jeotgali]EKE30780.1 putative ABC transporter ATP-binding protein [Salimicrobium jeotgali]MBM7697624.1 ABC-2 type transport system ATP-binding protein [Salimicrobium jeotgali]
MYAIETHNLTKKYSEKRVVNQISLKVKKGTIFGFLGKNGAGKSTFINMITGLTIPTEGSYSLLSNKDMTLKEKRTKIGVLPDYSTFYDDLTAIGHLKYFSKILGLNLSKEDMIETLKSVGLEDAINQKAKKFSFGMKKKLGIAQALINKPDLLFLDEPTSGVDANAILNIHEIINNVAEQGTTIFLTSHNLDEVEKMCDEIAIMDKGVIRTQGTMEQLKNNYQNNLTVSIKHGTLLEGTSKTLEQELHALGTNIQMAKNKTSIVVSDEDTIPIVNKIFLNMEIDVFRIEVDEPTLEEIFLNTGETKQTA